MGDKSMVRNILRMCLAMLVVGVTAALTAAVVGYLWAEGTTRVLLYTGAAVTDGFIALMGICMLLHLGHSPARRANDTLRRRPAGRTGPRGPTDLSSVGRATLTECPHRCCSGRSNGLTASVRSFLLRPGRCMMSR